MSNNLNSKHLNSTGFYNILKIIFEYNYFFFENTFYKQIKGVAMGTIAGPAIANLYVYLLETKWFSIKTPLHYSRYIHVDDLFIISNDVSQINSLHNSFRNLKLNIEIGNKVNFLDLNISINKTIYKLEFSLYIKPTNTFSYLLTSSNHPKYIFKNIPKSLYIRIRKNNSTLSDYFYFARELTFQLIKRGYEFSTLRKISNSVSRLNRSSLLEYKTKENDFANIDRNTFLFKFTFDQNIPNYKTILESSFKKTTDSNQSLKNTKIKVITTIQPNVSSILLNNFKISNQKYYYCFKCNLNGCRICSYLIPDYKIKISDSFYIPISCNSNCKSKNCVYLILCKQCKKTYIGQTKDIYSRIKSHLYDIKNFVPFISDKKCVPYHFSLKGHDLYKDFAFYIINANTEDLDNRLALESAYINIVYNYNKKCIINDYIPKPFFKKKVF